MFYKNDYLAQTLDKPVSKIVAVISVARIRPTGEWPDDLEITRAF
jgi:hypothetical protein